MRITLQACLLVLALSPAFAMAAPAVAKPGAGQGEITHLLDHLAQSRCEFERNGRWYGVADARAHLERKLRHLRGRIDAPSAEQFIEHAATASSLSGKPYQVRCPGQPVTASAAWFQSELGRFRAAD